VRFQQTLKTCPAVQWNSGVGSGAASGTSHDFEHVQLLRGSLPRRRPAWNLPGAPFSLLLTSFLNVFELHLWRV